MKWFKHMTDAHDSKDLTKVRIKYGADGYAIYWYCLELIAGDLGQDEITFELKHDAEVIGHNLKIDTLRVEEIMMYMVRLGLFTQSNNTITCLKLAKYLEKKTTRNKTIHKIIDTANSLNNNQLPVHVPDSRGQSGNCPGLSPLDTDTDTEREDIYITKKKSKFTPPTIEEVKAYCVERKNNIDPEYFVNYNQQRGWMVGKQKMKDWKAGIRTWEHNDKKWGSSQPKAKRRMFPDD